MHTLLNNNRIIQTTKPREIANHSVCRGKLSVSHFSPLFMYFNDDYYFLFFFFTSSLLFVLFFFSSVGFPHSTLIRISTPSLSMKYTHVKSAISNDVMSFIFGNASILLQSWWCIRLDHNSSMQSSKLADYQFVSRFTWNRHRCCCHSETNRKLQRITFEINISQIIRISFERQKNPSDIL